MTARTAAVTGAASGIGRASALLLASRGWSVLCADVNQGGLDETVACIADRGGAARPCVADVSADDQARAVVAAAAELGPLGALVNVAGIMVDDDRVEALTVECWSRVLATNLTSVFLLTRHAVPRMRDAGGGAIVNVASVHAFATMAGNAAYAASKGGIVALTRELALELAPYRIRAVAVAPGSVDTPMSRQAVDRAGVGSLEELGFSSSPGVAGRVGRPEEVASVIAWLVSDGASFVNGTTVPVDGALLARLL